ncbi:MAG: hypothetical protein BWY89_00081 [Bacteroidetes bacterium ADurb.BinA012]|nr:MAG: hypothetical protein BWY89_00081 [Bacteroidetes bacterium ADurb.BinA012]
MLYMHHTAPGLMDIIDAPYPPGLMIGMDTPHPPGLMIGMDISYPPGPENIMDKTRDATHTGWHLLISKAGL